MAVRRAIFLNCEKILKPLMQNSKLKIQLLWMKTKSRYFHIKESITSRTALQETLKEVLHAEGKWNQMFEHLQMFIGHSVCFSVTWQFILFTLICIVLITNKVKQFLNVYWPVNLLFYELIIHIIYPVFC